MRKELKGITYCLTHGDAAMLAGPRLNFYSDPKIAGKYAREIAVHATAIEVLKIATARPTACYFAADPSGPTIKVELPDGLIEGERAALHTIGNAEAALREAVELLGIPEHDFKQLWQVVP